MFSKPCPEFCVLSRGWGPMQRCAKGADRSHGVAGSYLRFLIVLKCQTSKYAHENSHKIWSWFSALSDHLGPELAEHQRKRGPNEKRSEFRDEVSAIDGFNIREGEKRRRNISLVSLVSTERSSGRQRTFGSILETHTPRSFHQTRRKDRHSGQTNFEAESALKRWAILFRRLQRSPWDAALPLRTPRPRSQGFEDVPMQDILETTIAYTQPDKSNCFGLRITTSPTLESSSYFCSLQLHIRFRDAVNFNNTQRWRVEKESLWTADQEAPLTRASFDSSNIVSV
jgi:hypothetical protein